MKKLSLLFMVLVLSLSILGCSSKSSKEELAEYRKEITAKHSTAANIWNQMEQFVDLNQYNLDSDPLTIKFYINPLITEEEKYLTDLKNIKVSKELQPIHDLSIKKSEGNIKFIKAMKEAIENHDKIAVKKEEIKKIKEENNSYQKQYEAEVAKIAGSFEKIEPTAPPLQLSNPKIERQNQFYSFITGNIKNNTGKKISYAEVQFTLYDKDGNQTQTAMTNIVNLEKDGSWSFKIPTQNNDFSVVRFSDIKYRE